MLGSVVMLSRKPTSIGQAPLKHHYAQYLLRNLVMGTLYGLNPAG